MIPKFRAWDKFYECMITPAGIELENGEVTHIIEQLPGETTKSSITYFELIQSTGLKDKNGVEIYEGDILHHKVQGASVVFYPYRDTMASFGIRNIKDNLGTTLKDTAKAGYEIIGNKYEHPHLLEE